MESRFSRVRGRQAERIPLVGPAIGGMASPIGLATVAAGGLAAALGSSVKKIVDTERELRPMIERSNLAAETLQVLTIAANKLGSEDGLDGVTDGAQELGLRLAEAATDGTGVAVAAFEKLGLSQEELIAKSPEQAFLDVITALQGVEDASVKKFLADELMGGASEKLSGIINTSAEDFAALTAGIEDSHAIISGAALQDAQEMGAVWGRIGQVFAKTQVSVGRIVIPLMTRLFTEIERMIPLVQRYFLPLWAVLGDIWSSLWFVLRELWTAIAYDFARALRLVGDFLTNYVLPPLKVFANFLRDRLPGESEEAAGKIRLIGQGGVLDRHGLGRCQGCDDRIQRDPGHRCGRQRYVRCRVPATPPGWAPGTRRPDDRSSGGSACVGRNPGDHRRGGGRHGGRVHHRTRAHRPNHPGNCRRDRNHRAPDLEVGRGQGQD